MRDLKVDVLTAAEMYSRLLGLRLTARLEPDVTDEVFERIALLIEPLDQERLQAVLLATLDSATDMYVERDPTLAHRQAGNIARAIREALDGEAS